MNAASGQTARPTDLTCQPLPLLSHFLRNFFETIQIYLSFHQSPRSLSCWGLPSFLWLGDPFKFVGIDFDSFLQSAKWAVVLRCLGRRSRCENLQSEKKLHIMFLAHSPPPNLEPNFHPYSGRSTLHVSCVSFVAWHLVIPVCLTHGTLPQSLFVPKNSNLGGRTSHDVRPPREVNAFSPRFRAVNRL